MKNTSRLIQQINDLEKSLRLVKKERDDARARIAVLSHELSVSRINWQLKCMLKEAKLYNYQAKFQGHLGITEAEQFEKLKERTRLPVLLDS